MCQDLVFYVETHPESWKQFEVKLFEGYEMLRYRQMV